MITRVNGVDLDYEVRGAGPPLLLIAGTGYPGATWRLPQFIDALASHFTVVTYDHRGTGGTPGHDGTYFTREFADDARGLLHALDIGHAHVLGHSMGGRVAQWVALDEPTLVRSLVLAASGPGGRGNPGQPAGLPLEAMVKMVERGYRGYMERHIPETFFTPDFVEQQPERVQWLVEAFWEHRPSVRDYLKHMSARQNHDTSRRLAEITSPVLVLVGDADVRRGPTGSHVDQSRHLFEHIPGAAMVTLPALSHGMFWQGPDLVIDVLQRWDAKVTAGTARRSHEDSAGEESLGA